MLGLMAQLTIGINQKVRVSKRPELNGKTSCENECVVCEFRRQQIARTLSVWCSHSIGLPIIIIIIGNIGKSAVCAQTFDEHLKFVDRLGNFRVMRI